MNYSSINFAHFSKKVISFRNIKDLVKHDGKCVENASNKECNKARAITMLYTNGMSNL